MSKRLATDTAPPSTEVRAQSTRRTFTAAYKREVLRRADACKKPGELGALLRKEGLYHSHLSKWREARDGGALSGEGRKRGPQPKPADPSAQRVTELERQVVALERRALRAEALVDLQKKVAEILGNPLLDLDGKP
jgi:transposase